MSREVSDIPSVSDDVDRRKWWSADVAVTNREFAMFWEKNLPLFHAVCRESHLVCTRPNALSLCCESHDQRLEPWHMGINDLQSTQTAVCLS
jgi:hypothetical protein